MSGNIGKMNDPDATLFVQVAEITDSTQRGAIVDLVKDLKSNNLWSKMKAIYPFIGGTATTHKWNLKDPRDTNAAFRLTFTGGWTHSSTGADPNGTNAYADTYFVSATQLTASNAHMAFYLREQPPTLATADFYAGGAREANSPFDLYFIMDFYRSSGNVANYTMANGPIANVIDNTNTTALGLSMINRTGTGTNQQKLFVNGVNVSTNTNNSTLNTNRKIFIGALHNENTPYGYGPMQHAFATIGDGLTDSEATNLYTIVQKYQTTLGRQV